MRHAGMIVLLLGLSMTALAPVGTAEEPETADVTLRVAPVGFVVPSHWLISNEAVWVIDPIEETSYNDEDGVAGCELTVPDQPDANGQFDGRIDGLEVLDRATATDCITGYEASFHPQFGAFVTSVDDLDEVAWPVGHWALYLDGTFAPVGISSMDLTDGQDLSFVYSVG